LYLAIYDLYRCPPTHRRKVMTSIRLFGLLPVTLAVMPALARAASRDVGGLVGKLKSAAPFCDGTYALCIKAPCMPIMTQGGSGPASTARSAPATSSRAGRWAPPAAAGTGGKLHLPDVDLFQSGHCHHKDPVLLQPRHAVGLVLRLTQRGRSEEPRQGELQLSGQADRDHHAGRR